MTMIVRNGAGVPAPRGLWTAVLLAGAMLLGACERTESDQRGPRGTSQIQVNKPSAGAALADLNSIPPAEEAADPEAPPASEVFVNVQVLKDLNATEFSRVMQAFTTWVSPNEGCEFCHNPDKLESDEKYPKVVARRMIEMTRRINTDWKSHVGGTGVTCWTCHRGQAVPSGDWFAAPGAKTPASMVGYRAGQNAAGVKTVGNASLPVDPLSTYLTTGNEVRVQGTTALRTVRHDSVKQAESTYSLMMYIANSLGVNCTYCHNTRAMANWNESTPQRVTAWHGIRMVRDLNMSVLIPLKPLLPVHRLSAEGDTPKVGCETCHKGSFKPLAGVSMLPDYPELAGVIVRPPAASAAALVPGAPASAAVPVAEAGPKALGTAAAK